MVERAPVSHTDWSNNNHQIKDVRNGTDPGDAVNLGQLEASGGGSGVIPVATGNITSTPFTPTDEEEILRFDATAGVLSVVLTSTDLTSRNVWRLVKMDTSSNVINVTLSGGGTFQNGATTFVISMPYSCYSFAIDANGNAVVF
jgi:hypothetical protein